MFDDLEGLTIPNAIDVFNRVKKSARNLLLDLHAQQRFRDPDYLPFGGRHRLTLDGTAWALTAQDWRIETSMILAPYRRSHWPDGAGVYVAISLTPDDGDVPELHAGAFHAPHGELVWEYASRTQDEEDLRSDDLARTDKAVLSYLLASDRSEWVFTKRPWRPGDADADILWTLDALSAGALAWDRGGHA